MKKLIFIFSFFFMFPLMCFADTNYFVANFTSDSYIFAGDNYYSFTQNKSSNQRYQVFTSTSDISINVPFEMTIGISNVPTGNEYFYIYGFSNVSLDSAWNSFGACENITKTSSQYPVNSDQRQGLFLPFSFKCNINKNSNSTYFSFYASMIAGNPRTYKPIVYISNTPFVSTSGTSEVSQKVQEQIEEQQKTNQELGELNDNITNSNVDGADSSASEWSSKSMSDSVVSDMVTMPITLLQAYLNGFNGSCKPYNLGNLYGTDLILPCINIENYLGSALWSVIDILFSGFMIFALGKKFVKIFNDFTNLKDNQVNELYGGGN